MTSRKDGFSTAEATTTLAALSIVAATMAPPAADYLARERLVKATADAHTIAVALVRMTDDVGPQSRIAGGWATFDLLVGEGEVPLLGAGGDGTWIAAAGDPRVGLLGDQLVVNDPRYTAGPLRLGSPCGWHGPYIENGIMPDPWGYRYAVNSQWLAGDGGFDTVVASPGPNGSMESPFKADGLVPRGDDILALVSAGS